MKNFIFSLLLVAVYSSATAQYKLSFEKPTLKGDKFQVTLRMAGNQNFGLGSNNLRFNVPAGALANPRIVSEKFPKGAYNETTLEGTNVEKGIVSVNTAFVGQARANKMLINKKGTDLVTLEFDVVDAAQLDKLSWRIKGAQPRTAVVADDKLTILAPDKVNNEVLIAQSIVTTSNTVKSTELTIANIAPNPAKELSTIAFSSGSSNEVQLTITDMLGRTVQSQTIAAYKGNNQAQLHLNDLMSGTYIVKITNGTESAVERLVKQ